MVLNFSEFNLKGKPVKIRSGPATVKGSPITLTLIHCQMRWEGCNGMMNQSQETCHET